MTDSFASVMGTKRGTSYTTFVLTLGARIRGNSQYPSMEGREGLVRKADPESDILQIQLFNGDGDLQNGIHAFRVCEVELLVEGRAHDFILPDKPISDLPAR